MDVKRSFNYWHQVVRQDKSFGIDLDTGPLVAVGLTICELLRDIRDDRRKFYKQSVKEEEHGA